MLWDGSNKRKKTNPPTKDPNLPVLRMGALLWTHSFWDKQFLGEMESLEVWVRQRGKAESRWGIRAVHTGRGRGDLDLHHKAEAVVFLHFTPKYTHRTRGSQEPSHPGSCKIPGDWSEPPPLYSPGASGGGGHFLTMFHPRPHRKGPQTPCVSVHCSFRKTSFPPLTSPHPGILAPSSRAAELARRKQPTSAAGSGRCDWQPLPDWVAPGSLLQAVLFQVNLI